jgi:hypothetical protein
MIAKLTSDDSPPLPSGTLEKAKNLQHSSTAAQSSYTPQQDVLVFPDSNYNMMDVTSLDGIFENPDMLNWVSKTCHNEHMFTNPSQQNDIDNYLIDYSGTFVHAGFDMPELVT